jgi:hydroxyacylglutathione hydrolase
MLNQHLLTFGPFQENTYILYNEHKQCWITDPGMYGPEETEEFISYIEDHQLQPQAIINTHAHIDHIFGVQALVDKYNIPFAIHTKEQPILDYASSSASVFGLKFGKTPKPDYYLKENEPFSLGNDTLQIRFTPGHSPGSIVFYYPEGKWLIGGDVLFAGSIGRTDLPGGNYQTLIDSIRSQLLTLPPDTKVYPGHGPATTIADEMRSNPFLQ